MNTQTSKKQKMKRIIANLIMIIVIPVLLMAAGRLGDRYYYLISVIVLVIAMVPFFLRFEHRKPSSREMVTLAVMTALAVAARAAFVMIPHVRPMVGIIMITGICLGAEAGFLSGSLAALVSNFIIGQGPWTPWQMFAFGLAGFIMGLLAEKHILKAEKRIPVTVVGALLVLCVIGPFLDTCTLFLETININGASAAAVYAAGLPINVLHAIATAVTLFILCKPIYEKVERIRIKYGLMEDEP